MTRRQATREMLCGKRVAVVGAGRSGLGAARALRLVGADVLILDAKPASGLDGAVLEELRALDVTLLAGVDMSAPPPQSVDFVVTSPGVPRHAPLLQLARAAGVPVWSEIELAFRVADAPIIAITGTNGKTTTTLLAEAILQEAGIAAVACGNIAADAVKRTLVDAALESADVIVAEVSSFQLEWVDSFAPHVAALTNVTRDHLDRYGDVNEYARTKARVFGAQSSQDLAVVNWDDPLARRIGASLLAARTLWLTCGPALPEHALGAWVEGGYVRARTEPGGDASTVLRTGDLPSTLAGPHNVANVMAAALCGLALGASAPDARTAVLRFPGVPHRMEVVADLGGVLYINNSMCTNPDAAVCSLEAVARVPVLICGGADKGAEFDDWARAVALRARHTVLIGTAAAKMQRALQSSGYSRASRAQSLEEAVREARRFACPGDAVVLSPACASFDMFADFEDRGAAFRRAVKALEAPDL